MTDEEIVETSKRLAEEIYLVLKSDSDFPPQDAATLIARQLISCTSQAYEEAAKAICSACADGNVVKRCDELGHYPYEHVYEDGAVFSCGAERIRALMDSFVKEEVSA